MSEEKSEKVKKRDYSIDLIRVIACVLVVATHLSLQVFNEYYHEVDWSRLIEKCFFTDGVPLFFMITGFFIINGRGYKKIVKSTFFKVIIPSFIYVLFAQIFYMFILNKESFVWCLKNAFVNLNLGGILESVLKADVVPINSLCAHLWYIYSYIKIILWVPVIWLLCSKEKNPKLARRMIIIFGVLGMLIVDIQKFITLPFGKIALMQYVDRELIYVLLGYELYINRDRIKNNKKLCIGSLLGWILINIIRYKIENHYMVINSFYNIVGRDNFLEWRYTVVSVFSGVLLFIFLYSFEIKNEKFNKIIYNLSKKTFGIYLIHYLLIAKVDLYKFDKIGTLPRELLYLALSIPITWISSYIIVTIIQYIKEKIRTVAKKA